MSEAVGDPAAGHGSDGAILVVNAGSTSLKLSLVDSGERSEPLGSLAAAAGRAPAAVAHRVVHGGPGSRQPVLIDAGVRERIRAAEPLAPLHNAPALAGIEEAAASLPDVPQVAVFDTAFHASIPPWAASYPVPRRWREEWGVHRYGFHGLAVAWVAERVPALLRRPPEGLRTVVCHLGGGCSVTALRDGRSLDTTMGFSPLEGVPMATRSGSVDPGALIYLLRERGLDVDELELALDRDSGLRGLADGSGDMRELLRAEAAGEAGAALAIEVFVNRLAGAVAAMAASAGGLDALAFSGGIGENSAPIRARVCARLAFLGAELDGGRNADAEPDAELQATGSAVAVLAIRAREDVVAARAARAVLATA